MKFNSEKVSFGRHAAFPFRYSWLTKGYYALKEDTKIFSSDEATVVLGVGKNMAESIRYWLLASKVVENTSCGLNPTKLGQAIFEEDGFSIIPSKSNNLLFRHENISLPTGYEE